MKMQEETLRQTGITVAIAALLAAANVVLAQDSPRMPAHRSPFVSGVVTAGQNSLPQPGTPTTGIPAHQNPVPFTTFITRIKDAHAVTKAVVILTPPGSESPILQTQLQFRNRGCPTRDPSRIASLLALLRAAILMAAPPVASDGDGGEAVYLTLTNGQEIHFSFGFPTQVGVAVPGVFRWPGIPVQHLTANASLAEDLYFWTEATGEIAGSGPRCRDWAKEQIKKLFSRDEGG